MEYSNGETGTCFSIIAETPSKGSIAIEKIDNNKKNEG